MSYETDILARVWPFVPNWKDGVKTVLEYRTEIITSRTGKEQRIATRQTPRKEISFKSVVHAGAFRRFIGHMDVWQNRPTMMPEFGRGAHLAVDAIAGTYDLVLSESVKWAQVGQVVALISGDMKGARHLVGTITNVVGSTITISSVLPEDWVAGSRVYPITVGRLARQMNSRQITNNTADVDVEFVGDPGIEIEIPLGSPDVMHMGREVFMRKPNWADSITLEYNALLETLDYGFGRMTHYRPIPFNDRIIKANYVSITQDRMDDMVQFFMRQKGQVGEFFMPTFNEDILINSPLVEFTSTISVDGHDLYEDMGDGLVYRDLVVILNDGTMLMRHVISIDRAYVLDNPVTIIQLNAEWPSNIQPEAVNMVSWMPLCRFASDSLTISWLTNQLAETSLSIRTLEYVEGED